MIRALCLVALICLSCSEFAPLAPERLEVSMATTANPNNLYLGRGRLFFDRFDDNGNPTGERFLGNVRDLNILVADIIRSKPSRVKPDSRPIVRGLHRRLPEISFIIDEFNRDNLAVGLMGEASSYSQPGTPVVGESIGPIKKEHYFALDKRRITAVTVSKGATVLDAGIDYEIEAEGGRIGILETLVKANEGDNLTVDYTPEAIVDAEVVAMGLTGIIEGSLRFLADPAVGPSWQLEVWHAQLRAGGSVAVLIDEFGEAKMRGSILESTSDHPDDPFYRLIEIGEDVTRPGKVIDFQCVERVPPFPPQKCRTTWTAAGDDGFAGTAVAVAIRWSVAGPVNSEAEWDVATPVPGWDWVTNTEPGGTAMDEILDVIVGDLLTTYFVLRYMDEAGNIGPISNNAIDSPS